MADHDLESICAYLTPLAQEAGILMLSTPCRIIDKKNTADVVTEIDQAVESFVRDELQRQYPNFAFIGEESYRAGVALTDAPTFIVDPIDGTSNFVHQFPEVCISIGLVIEKQPRIGVVYNPFREELWVAINGQGAYVTQPKFGRRKLPLAKTALAGLASACIGIDMGSDREGPNWDLNVKVFTSLAKTVQTGGKFVNSLRCTGSAALAICRVAAGQQDAFWECGCWAWDVCAAWCVLVEAGGIMVDGHPGEWSPAIDNRRYLAVRPASEGQDKFVEEFWSVLGDSRSTYGPPC